MARGEASTDPSWRERLGRRLVLLTAAMSLLVFLPVTMGTHDAALRSVLSITTALLVAGLLWLARASVEPRLRAIGAVAAFFVIGATGHATVGFLGAPALGFCAAVVVAGVLLGRRAMLSTVALTCVAVASIGALMVFDVIPSPPYDDITPRVGRNWMRSSTLTLILILILGIAVTWVVEHIEATRAQVAAEARRRRKIEQQAVNAQATELLGRVAAGLAHDVNNQLTVIAGWTGLLGSKAAGATAGDAQAAIKKAVTTAADLTKQLLVLGRKEIRSPRTRSLTTIVRAHVKTLSRVLPDNVQVEAASDGHAWALVDEGQMQQVLLNLVLNARDAMAHGGRVHVQTAMRDDVTGVVGHRGPIPAGSWSVLEVRDEGVGMDEVTRARVFEPFFTTKPRGQGTGLGLATVAAIAEQSEGHVVLDSDVGVGTTVQLWFPERSAPDDDADESTGRHVEGSFRSTRVLFVDDNLAVVDVVRRGLIQAGFEVVTAVDADDAIGRLAKGPFDLLCSDVVMPGTPVSKLIEAFSRAYPHAPVLLCSGHLDEDAQQVREEIERGRVHFLPKPYGIPKLVACMDELLDREEARVVAAAGNRR
jgi:signal transduction histidine kinase/CheY-like chemotaxis protein